MKQTFKKPSYYLLSQAMDGGEKAIEKILAVSAESGRGGECTEERFAGAAANQPPQNPAAPRFAPPRGSRARRRSAPDAGAGHVR